MLLILVQGSINEVMTNPCLAMASNVNLILSGSGSRLPPFLLIVDLFFFVQNP